MFTLNDFEMHMTMEGLNWLPRRHRRDLLLRRLCALLASDATGVAMYCTGCATLGRLVPKCATYIALDQESHVKPRGGTYVLRMLRLTWQ